MSKVNYGTVDIECESRTYTLKITPNAILKIEGKWGGIMAALHATEKMSYGDAAYIVCAAANIGQREQKEVLDDLLNMGILSVAPKIAEYIGNCLNPTGRESSVSDDSLEEDSEGE